MNSHSLCMWLLRGLESCTLSSPKKTSHVRLGVALPGAIFASPVRRLVHSTTSRTNVSIHAVFTASWHASTRRLVGIKNN